ncbi:hypothetical protein [Maribacter sp. 2307ULW6-5]|uniref:hypothetical protein n=1 Tax=Maribacter sp. 2307ULW6-5 TaxID=3386275 RepID=UPI0039BD463E
MQVPKTEQKQALLKSYNQLSELEAALKTVNQGGTNKIMITIIGNLEDVHANDRKDLAHKKRQLQSYFKELLGTDTDFDTFCNSEIGCLFVAGFLVSMFLNPVGKKTLGELSGGIYGVFRGLGVSEAKANLNAKRLKDGKYLLLVRGKRFDIEKLKDRLEDSK